MFTLISEKRVLSRGAVSALELLVNSQNNQSLYVRRNFYHVTVALNIVHVSNKLYKIYISLIYPVMIIFKLQICFDTSGN